MYIILDAEEMIQCMNRVQRHLSSANISSANDSSLSNTIPNLKDQQQHIPQGVANDGDDNNCKPLSLADSLIRMEDFRRLLMIHNKIQAVQCFQYPPNALCCDSKELVSEVRIKIYILLGNASNVERYEQLFFIILLFKLVEYPCMKY